MGWNKSTQQRRPTVAPAEAVSWAQLAEILGPPPLGAAGTSVTPAGGVYGESNPNSRAKTAQDVVKFVSKMGRAPTSQEKSMIEQRWLGWGYK